MKRNSEELKETGSAESSLSAGMSSQHELENQGRLSGLKERKAQLKPLPSSDSDSTALDPSGSPKESDCCTKPSETTNLSPLPNADKESTTSSSPDGKDDVIAIRSSVPVLRGKKRTSMDSSYSESEEDCEFVSHKVLFSYKSVFINSIVDITEEDKVRM